MTQDLRTTYHFEVDGPEEVPESLTSGKPKGRPAKYPFEDLVEDGMSFFVAEDERYVQERLFGNLSRLCYYRTNSLGITFKAQRDEKYGLKGVRVWRLQEQSHSQE